jgi:transcriptional regulator with XRE-family HTH domain
MEIAITTEGALPDYPSMDTNSGPDTPGLRLGRVLIARRKALGLTQSEVSSRAGFKQPRDLWRHEKEGVMPDVLRLQRIAAALQTTSDELCREAGVTIGSEELPASLTTASPANAWVNGEPIETIRHQAVRNLFKDPALKVQPEEVEILEDIVENLSALSGLAGVETLLRAAFLDYRKHPERYGEMVGVKHAFAYGPQSEAGKRMTDDASASGAAKGHAQLGKPKGKR